MKIISTALTALLCCTQAQAYKLPEQPTKAYECTQCDQLSHEPLQDRWALTNEALYTPKTNTQKNYGYKFQVTSKKLRAGVSLQTNGPKARIIITSKENNPLPNVHLIGPNKHQLTFNEKNQNNKQSAIQIPSDYGSGAFLIKSTDINSEDSGSFDVQVLDNLSVTYLQVQTNALQYFYGDAVEATITLANNSAHYKVEDLSTSLKAPNGDSSKLTITEIAHNTFQTRFIMDSEESAQGEKWYIEVNAHSFLGQKIIKRHGHAAFSYTIPSASLTNVKKTSSKPLKFITTLKVATASRYSLQAVLFSKNKSGEFEPLETVHSSQWLEPGTHSIPFNFDNSQQLNEHSLYLGYLRLVDYGQLTTVYRYDQPIELKQLVE